MSKKNLQEETIKALMSDSKLNEGKKVEAVTPDKEYQGIKYFDNKDGWCPVCNAQLHYQPVEYAGDDVVYYGWDCDKCGAKGEAYFKQSFIGHSIYDDNFDLIELPFDEIKTEGKKTEAKLEDIQMEIYELIQNGRRLDKQDKETNVKETLNAIRLEYPEISREELKSYIERKADEIYAGGYDEKNESKKVEAKETKLSFEDWKDSDLYIPALLKYYDVDTEEELADCNISENDIVNIYNEYASSVTDNDEYSYYEIHFDFTEESGKDSDGYSKFFKSKKDVEDDIDEIWNLAIMEDVIGEEDDYYDVDYAQKIDKDEYERATRTKVESKKVEAIDKEKVLNMKYADLPDMCYGLLPSDNSVIVIKKGENGYYKTDFDDIEDTEEFVNRENSKMGVTPEQRMVMELRSMSGNWVLPNEGDKKVEDVNKLNNMYEQGTTELERAFTTEVKYWLQALIDDNPNDEVGVQALNVIDDEAKIKEIVDELVNGSDDLWEAIHLKIEQLAGIDYRNSTRGKVESKKIKENVGEENSLDDIADYIKGIVDYNVSITPTGKGFSSYDVNFLNTDDSIMYSVMVNDFAINDKVMLLNTLIIQLKRLYSGKTFADGIREDLLNELNRIHPVDKKVTEAYNYNWKDDIEEVDNTEANDELAYAFAENLIETDPDYANYDDPWDVLSQIIYIWKIAKRSRLYDFLLKWYGSEEEMKKHIRSFYETSDAIYFETGAGYSFFSADLLGGTEDGNAAREFDDFVKNGGKRVK